MTAADLLVPAAQYVRMSTEHQPYSLENQIDRDTFRDMSLHRTGSSHTLRIYG
jgi:hypothetical protein